MISVRILRFALLLVVSLAASAQELTIKSKSELVEVPVVVMSHGALVKGLTKDDFKLIHDGKPQQIEVFEEVDVTTVPIGLPPLPPRTVQNFIPSGTKQDLVI